ncbi:MAG: hypothetical protein A2096_01385 [Spirochaetes bacterium GWF1_41_5]|nr:MAG: hypothetical protein A2096_01385 [Spirochaetes bacterium GWF1_41_5]HBE02000.1 hypothetical protein [Spirochaetia bacterium]
MNQKKIFILAAALFITACAGGVRKKGKPFVIMHPRNPALDRIFQKIGKEFQAAHPHLKVELQPAYATGFYSKILTAMAGGSAPDVFYMTGKAVTDFGQRGTLADLGPFIEKDNFPLGDIPPQALDEIGINSGNIFALPLTGGASALFYNKDLFERCGLAEPDNKWTWKEYLQAAKKLTIDEDKDGRPDVIGTSSDLTYWAGMLPWIWAAGGDLLSLDGNQCTVGSEQAAVAVQFHLDLINKHKVTVNESSLSTTGTSSELFSTGKVAMMVTLPWAIWEMASTGRKNKLNIALPPAGPQKRISRYTGEAVVIWAGSKYKEEAWDFLKRITSAAVGNELVKRYWQSTRLSVLQSSVFQNPDTEFREEILYKVLVNSRSLPDMRKLGGQDGIIRDIWNNEMTLCIKDGKSAAAALLEIQHKLNAELHNYKSK